MDRLCFVAVLSVGVGLGGMHTLSALGVVRPCAAHSRRRLARLLLGALGTYVLFSSLLMNFLYISDMQDYLTMAEMSRDAALETEGLSAAMELDLEDAQDQLRAALEELAALRRAVGTEAEDGGENGSNSKSGSNSGSSSDGGSGGAGSSLAGLADKTTCFLRWVTGSDAASGPAQTASSACAFRGSADAVRALERHAKYRQIKYLLLWGTPDRARLDRLRRELSVEFHPDKNRGCTAALLVDVNARINSFRVAPN